MERKITKKDRYNQLLAIAEVSANEDLVAFIKHEIELLEKKAQKTGTSKTQKENELLMNTLYEELSAIDKAVTISEFQTMGNTASTLSNQKISALFRLMNGTRVERTVVKGKTYFKAI